MVIGDLSVNCARRYPKKDATVFKEKRQSFSTFNQRVNKLVHAFHQLGLKKGDKVSVLSRNKPEVIEICFACAKAGIVFVPINFRLAVKELEFIMNNAEVDALFMDDKFTQEIKEIKENINVDLIYSINQDYEKLLSPHSPEEPDTIVEPEDLFAIFYTSGSTGLPKGVMLSHHNFISATTNHVLGYQLNPSDICLQITPFYHTAASSLVMCQFFIGGTNVIVDHFDEDEFWKLVEVENITYVTMVHTMLMSSLETYVKKGYKKNKLRKISLGGQTIPAEVLRKATELLGERSVFVVYGLTEAAPLISYLPPEEIYLDGPKSRRLASVGKEMFLCHIRIVDENGHDVKDGELGEIIVKGPNVMQGYWKLDSATEETIRDGWLHTGDLGMFDEDRFLYLMDRKKDLIISGGENISPREVEEVIYEIPDVSECAVIGAPDDQWGEHVKAIVVLKKQSNLTEDSIIDFCTGRIAKYKLPKSIEIVDSIPKDPVGKIRKKVLRESYS